MILKVLIIRSQVIVDLYLEGTYSKNEACDKLQELSEQAWKEVPDSEPDGDIEYTIALALEKIYNHSEINEQHPRSTRRIHKSVR
jgi:hypothetical protein